MTDTANRVLSLDEVMALEEGARVWVEMSRKSYFKSQAHRFSAAESRSIVEIREPRLIDMSGGWFPITAEWVNDEYRVWSLPQPPTPEEIEANPWRKEGEA